MHGQQNHTNLKIDQQNFIQNQMYGQQNQTNLNINQQNYIQNQMYGQQNQTNLNHNQQNYIQNQTHGQQNQTNLNINQQNNLEVTLHPHYQSTHFSDKCIHNVVKILPPLQVEYWTDYVMIRCPNVTTSWIEFYGFSYLTVLPSDENYFFFPLTDTGFNLNSWNEYSTKNKITREKLNEFISQLNTKFDLIAKIKTAKTAKTSINIDLICSGICTIIALISFIVLIIIGISEMNKIYLIFATCCLASFFELWCRFCREIREDTSHIREDTSHLVDRVLISTTSGLENFLNEWNMQYFLPNDLYVIAPRNLKYLQFILDKNIKFSLENHDYPYHRIPQRRYRY